MKIAELFSNKPSQCGWSLTHFWKSTNSLLLQKCYYKYYKWCSAEYSCVFSMCSKRCLTYCMFVDVLRWQAIYSESGQNVYSHVMLSNLYTFAVQTKEAISFPSIEKFNWIIVGSDILRSGLEFKRQALYIWLLDCHYKAICIWMPNFAIKVRPWDLISMWKTKCLLLLISTWSTN